EGPRPLARTRRRIGRAGHAEHAPRAVGELHECGPTRIAEAILMHRIADVDRLHAGVDAVDLRLHPALVAVRVLRVLADEAEPDERDLLPGLQDRRLATEEHGNDRDVVDLLREQAHREVLA